MTGEARYAVAASVLARPLGDEWIVLDVATGEQFALAGVGGLVWQCLLAGESLERIAAAVEAEHDVSPDAARRDVEVFVQQLLEQGLITRSDEG